MCVIRSEVDLAYGFFSELGLCPRTEQENGFLCALSLPCLVLPDLIAVGIRTGCGCGEENKSNVLASRGEEVGTEGEEAHMVV